MKKHCPCGREKGYEECCGALHRGARTAATAEELMRARYCAFVKHEIDFLIESSHPDAQREQKREDIERWARESTWEGLEIIDTHAGGAGDDEGVVEFLAFYDDDEGESIQHHERAFFERVDGRWTFVDGEPARQEPFVRESAKVGRNDPCACGSGKKHKKCCGSAG